MLFRSQEGRERRPGRGPRGRAGNRARGRTGSGAGGSPTYAVGFPESEGLGGISTITLSAAHTLAGAYFTNTTWAALSMLNGDGFAKQFGGASGDDPDWLLLSISGYDAASAFTGSVDVYLADYRFADNALDYVLDSWLWVDLTELGAVRSLDFVLSGSDMGTFGLNTPAYFAMDDLVVTPEPATAWLCASGLVALGLRARRRRA